MANIKIEGIEKLIGELKDNVTLNDVKRVVSHNGQALTRQMNAQTTRAYVKGYSTGDTASSINLHLENGGMKAVVEATMNYDPYVEYGTRFMAPEPIVQPSLDVIGPKFINDLQRLKK